MNDALEHIWGQVRADLERRVSSTDFEIWLAPLTAARMDGGELVLTAPAEIRTWVAERYAGRLLQATRSALGPEAEVRVIADDEPAPATARGTRRRGTDAPAPEPTPVSGSCSSRAPCRGRSRAISSRSATPAPTATP